MKKLYKTGVWMLGIAGLATFGCGSDSKPDTQTTNPGDDSDETSTAPSTSDTSSAAESTEPSSKPGDPVLSDLPPETPLSELDDDQRAEVCEAYVKTADAVSKNMAQLCPAQGVFLAAQSEADDDASFRAACSEAVTTCEDQVSEAEEEAPAERCEGSKSCEASIEEFNACNRQIAALNSLVLQGLVETDVPECKSTTQAAGTNVAATLLLQVAFGLSAVTQRAGGNPTDADGPCQRINTACPELGVSLGAFSEFGDLLQ